MYWKSMICTKKFGDFVAVDNISLSIEEGEVLILGQTGREETDHSQ